jgi:hypothetical protein
VESWICRYLNTYVTLTNLGLRYAPNCSKQPDNSWLPRDIDPNTPGVLHQPGSQEIYPTFVLEIAYQHETFPQMMRDAAEKHFAPTTSVQVYLGIKVYKTTRRYKAVLAVRAPGGGATEVDSTDGFLNLDEPTVKTFRIPGDRIWFGVPANMIPQTTTADLILSLECVRARVSKFL